MIIIKIAIKFTDEQLAIANEILKIRALGNNDLLSNGKSAGRNNTLEYQMLLILVEKLSKKLMKSRLHPTKKKTVKITFTYPEAFYLNKFLIGYMQNIENNQVRSLANAIVMKIDPQL